jgi:hypothetical protein
MPSLVLNARLNGVTFLTQEGTGFNNTSTVTLDDLNPTAADQYTFTCAVVEDTPRRLLIKVTCTVVPENTSRHAKVKVTVTTGGVAEDTGSVPVRLSNGLEPVLHQNRIPRARLRLKLNARSAVFIPGVGFGEVDEVVPCALVVPPSRGTWVVIRARQLARGVRVTLECQAIGGAGEGGGTTTDTLSVTLSPEEETTVTAPPVEVEYADNPDDDPE